MFLTKPTYGFDTQAYNCMLGVEDAYADLCERCALQEFLNEAAGVFRDHSMGGFGIFLLHRHFMVENKSIVLEERRRLKKGRYSLISKVRRPQTVEKKKEVYPSRWFWDSKFKKYRAIEFSRDDFVRNGNRILEERPDFALEYSQLLERTGLDKILGLAIGRREGLLLGVDEVYVETTDITLEESIIEKFGLGEIDPNTNDLTPTLWTHEDGDCWCKPTTKCKAYCFGSGPDHTKEHAVIPAGHEKVPCV